MDLVGVHVPLVALLVSRLFLLSQVHCEEKENCQRSKFVIDNDVVKNNIVKGHIIKRLTVDKAIQCHKMCRDSCRL